MAHLKLLDTKLDEYNKWMKELDNIIIQIEENILQKDNADKIQEKLVSIGIASVFVSIGSGIAGLFGVAAIGFSGGFALFAIGWFLSKGVNKKIFGDERKRDNIKENEEQLLSLKDDFQKFIKPIQMKLKIKKKRKEVTFTKYNEIKNEIEQLLIQLKEFDSSSLALKYRNRHSKLVQNFIIATHQFDKIYTGKK